MQPRLIVTVDTEEEGLWSGKFSGFNTPVANLSGIPSFQSICDEFGVRPTYLVNSPVVSDVTASAVFENIIERNAAEIGCHIHPWNTPPIEDDVSSERSYLCNLPIELQHQKLETVTRQIEERFGVRPTSFRAGRYGMSDVGVKILRELGYLVDSSVCPFMNYSNDGGPNYEGAPWKPYFIDSALCEPSSEITNFLEVPVSFGFNWKNFKLANRLDDIVTLPIIRRFRIKGILERTSFLQKIKFSPEKGDSTRMGRLARAYTKQDAPCIVMMFHSSSLRPGFSPYVASEAELDQFLATIRLTLKFCLGALGMTPATLTEFAKDYREHCLILGHPLPSHL